MLSKMLLHNLSHNGATRGGNWIGYRIDHHDYGVVEIYEQNPGYPNKWYYRSIYPDTPTDNYPMYAEDLMVDYARSLGRYVKSILPEGTI